MVHYFVSVDSIMFGQIQILESDRLYSNLLDQVRIYQGSQIRCIIFKQSRLGEIIRFRQFMMTFIMTRLGDYRLCYQFQIFRQIIFKQTTSDLTIFFYKLLDSNYIRIEVRLGQITDNIQLSLHSSCTVHCTTNIMQSISAYFHQLDLSLTHCVMKFLHKQLFSNTGLLLSPATTSAQIIILCSVHCQVHPEKNLHDVEHLSPITQQIVSVTCCEDMLGAVCLKSVMCAIRNACFQQNEGNTTSPASVTMNDNHNNEYNSCI